jgi:hypothetical protein
MKFSFCQEIEPNQEYGSAEALRKMATLIEQHERKYSCCVEIENMNVSIVAEIEENCVPLEVE